MRLAQAALVAAALASPLAAHAGKGLERLDGFFKNRDAVLADFEQTLMDEKNRELKQMHGTLILQRPGKFRWDYATPHRQLIIADGKRFWLYDADLEQVTVRAMDATLGATPAVLLSGERPLQESFVITELGVRGGEEWQGLEWVGLTPKAEDAGFTRLWLGFDEKELRAMELTDNFGQTTLIKFSNVRRETRVDPALFTFTPPPGVDVIGETGATRSK
jgi:chaperone LolA